MGYSFRKSSAATSMPDSPGMRASSITRSGICSAHMRSASAPEEASRTAYPASCIPLLKCGENQTIIIDNQNIRSCRVTGMLYHSYVHSPSKVTVIIIHSVHARIIAVRTIISARRSDSSNPVSRCTRVHHPTEESPADATAIPRSHRPPHRIYRGRRRHAAAGISPTASPVPMPRPVAKSNDSGRCTPRLRINTRAVLPLALSATVTPAATSESRHA